MNSLQYSNKYAERSLYIPLYIVVSTVYLL
jgi:hypothetical protein